MRRAFSISMLCGAFVAACHDEGHRGKTEPAAVGPPDSDLAAVGGLALAPSLGTAAVDVQIGHLQRAAARRRDNGELWGALGRAWVRKARETADPGFYLNAKAAADVALGIDPADSMALDLEGLVLLNDHRFEEARALAQRVVEAHPQLPAPYGTLSDALLELGRFDEAVRAAQQMVDLKPNLPSYGRASYLRWVAGDVPGAEQAARLAIDSGEDVRDPEPGAWMLTQTAMIFCHEGDYAVAEAGFDRALVWMSAYPPALVGKARVAMARGAPDQAVSLLRAAYDESPLVETAWLLGDAHSMAGDAEGARRAYDLVERTGLRTDHRTLALFWATKNEHAAEALALAEAEMRARPGLYTEDAYAWALYRNGKIDEAKAAIARALEHHTRDARLWYHAGAIRIEAGDVLAGRELIARALALEPAFDFTGAAEARWILADGKR
jgi:tetratricopeptide (TPR) repeat protein